MLYRWFWFVFNQNNNWKCHSRCFFSQKKCCCFKIVHTSQSIQSQRHYSFARTQEISIDAKWMRIKKLSHWKQSHWQDMSHMKFMVQYFQIIHNRQWANGEKKNRNTHRVIKFMTTATSVFDSSRSTWAFSISCWMRCLRCAAHVSTCQLVNFYLQSNYCSGRLKLSSVVAFFWV